jgi:hypothetical protein
MYRKYVLVGALVVAFATPAFAEDKIEKMESMNCTEADMATMETNMKSMMDADKKKMAMDEMDMAKKMMAKKDMDGCMMHMNKAMDSMGMMKK